MSEKTTSEIASDFEEGMRRGFLGVIILYLLDKKESHGYEMMEDISDITDGIWEPVYSTIYNSIQSLEKKGLIKVSKVGKRRKKIYVLTDKGSRTLEISAEKLMGIIRTMRSMLVSFFGLDSDYSVKKDLF